MFFSLALDPIMSKLGRIMSKTVSFTGLPSLFLLAALGLGPTVEAGAQLRLQQPETVFPEDFGAIQTVRELPGGVLLVADPLGKALYRVDMTSGTRTVVGREGPVSYTHLTLPTKRIV